ncbi:hypothetical protein [Caudoviricetes sp.]|nr:hypothetical protein [Caudoviricetes sp.]
MCEVEIGGLKLAIRCAGYLVYTPKHDHNATTCRQLLH